MTIPLYLYAASGHAKVVMDAAIKSGRFHIAGILDDNPRLKGERLLSYPILGGEEVLSTLDPAGEFIIAIGVAKDRIKVAERVIRAGFSLATVVHPSAQIGLDVEISEGSVIFAGVVVNPATKIGRLAILNTSCSVDHDCVIGEAAHICPGVRLAGNVTIGAKCWIGVGTSVIEGISIGADTYVGAGAVVIDDLPAGVRVVGSPAKRYLPNHQ